jgi:WD40 repeat protein
MVSSVDLLMFSPDGQILAISAGDREKTYLWRVADGHLVATISLRSASVGFSPDGQEITLGGDPVRVFHVVDGHEVRQFAAAGQVALSPDGRLLAVTKEYSDDGLRIFRYQDGALLQTFRGAYGYSYLAAFSQDSRYLATMYVPGGSGSNLGVGAISLTLFSTKVPITVWRTSDWGKVQTLAGNPGGANVLAFSPDGQHMASVGDDLRLWPLAPRHPLWFLIGPLSVLLVLVSGAAWWMWSRR